MLHFVFKVWQVRGCTLQMVSGKHRVFLMLHFAEWGMSVQPWHTSGIAAFSPLATAGVSTSHRPPHLTPGPRCATHDLTTTASGSIYTTGDGTACNQSCVLHRQSAAIPRRGTSKVSLGMATHSFVGIHSAQSRWDGLDPESIWEIFLR